MCVCVRLGMCLWVTIGSPRAGGSGECELLVIAPSHGCRELSNSTCALCYQRQRWHLTKSPVGVMASLVIGEVRQRSALARTWQAAEQSLVSSPLLSVLNLAP